MAGSRVTQRIALEGADQIKQELRQIGDAGRNAFQQIRDAGQSVRLDAVETAAKRAGVTVEEMRARVAAARATLDTLGATSREAATQATGMGRAARDAVSGLNNLNDASDQAGSTIGATDVAAIRFGQTLRLLGRAAGIHELSQLGRTMGVLGAEHQDTLHTMLGLGANYFNQQRFTEAFADQKKQPRPFRVTLLHGMRGDQYLPRAPETEKSFLVGHDLSGVRVVMVRGLVEDREELGSILIRFRDGEPRVVGVGQLHADSPAR